MVYLENHYPALFHHPSGGEISATSICSHLGQQRRKESEETASTRGKRGARKVEGEVRWREREGVGRGKVEGEVRWKERRGGGRCEVEGDVRWRER